MGTVLAVHDEETGRDCALKLLNRPNVRVDAARVLREGRALMQISNEHVVQILDVAEHRGWGPFLVLERLHGNSLAELAPKGHAFLWSQVVSYALQTCDALGHVHALGIIHRDIKPSNLFLTRDAGPDGEPILKVLDFGIAKMLAPDGAGATSSLTAGALGSPQFMSPEQIANPRLVDARTDLWSLGVVIFRLVTGRYPFAGANLGELSAAVLKGRYPTFEACGIEAPASLQAAVARCLMRRPEDRWPSAMALAEALHDVGW
jgi:serine/threonine-protein kinase